MGGIMTSKLRDDESSGMNLVQHVIAVRTKQEIEEIVVFARLELYNQGLPCGPKAIRARIDALYLQKQLPSESTIARILVKRCLTHGRTGCYE